MNTSLPKKQGLYDPWFEHDACGVGVLPILRARSLIKFYDRLWWFYITWTIAAVREQI